MKTQNQVLFQADNNLVDWMVDIRRTIHQYPELANEEHRTQEFIAEKLDELGIPYRIDTVRTGLVATLGSLPKTDTKKNLSCVISSG